MASSSGPQTGDRSGVAQGRSHSREEKLYLAGIILLTLLLGALFLALSAWSIFVPAMGISFLFGLTVATLAYAFLGARGHDHVKIRGIQLAGAVAVVVALMLLINKPLEQQFDLQRQLAQAKTDRAALQRQIDSAKIIEKNITRRIGQGSRISLLDVNTLNGWEEGPHSENLSRPEGEKIFTDLFQRLDIQVPFSTVRNMTDEQWTVFLSRLPNGKRMQIGGIPFAKLRSTSSDGQVEQHVVLKGQMFPILDREGKVETYVCMGRILDVRERRSGEPEIVVISHSVEPCEQS